MKKNLPIPKLRFKPNGNIPEYDTYKKHLFSDIFIFSTGKNIKQNEASPEFETPCVRYGELYHMYNEVINKVINRTNIEKSKLLLSQGNEILLPSAGEDPMDIGSASALIVKNVAIGRTINILKPKHTNIYSQIYVAYYISQKLRKKISSLAKGVSISNVYNSDLRTLEITLPNLPEQQKVASFIFSIDEKIQLLTRKKELLEQYKKGVMQQLFSGKLRFKDKKGKAFPKWEEKRLDEIGMTFNGLTGKSKESFGRGVPYIQYMQVFSNAKIDIGKCGLVQIDKNENQQTVKCGDIFFTTSSETTSEIATASVLLEKVGEMYLNSFCFGFRPFSLEQIEPNFACYLFRNEMFRKQIIKLAQGSTRYNISKVQFLKLTISLPCNAEQIKISNYLICIDKKIDSTLKEITQTQDFKKGLLQQMFV